MKLHCLVPAQVNQTMEEVHKEYANLMGELGEKENIALNIFVDTLLHWLIHIAGYLPSEEKKELLSLCAKWFECGCLVGASPKVMVDILDRISAKVVTAEAPEWVKGEFNYK